MQASKKAETETESSLPGLAKYDVKSVKADFFSSPAMQEHEHQLSHSQSRSPGSKQKEAWKEVDVFEVDEHGELLFNDAPVSLPSLTPLEKSSYFGSRARFEFLDIFRQLSRQRYNFRDNKFMTFDSVIEEVENSKVETVKTTPKPKMKKSGTTRFASHELIGRKATPPNSSSRLPLPPSPTKRLKSHFQRKMSTEEDPIEVTSEIESDVANLHLTLPKEGPAKFARPLSPRHRFILGCINSKITPRPSLLIRKDLSTMLNLEHQNMGDAGGILLANALDGLPHLCALNIADNNLTDAGLTAIIKKLPACHFLSSLDVSENKIDAEAADELSSYLLSPACALIDIVMRKSDVDDNEIGSFIQAIGHSNKLINVDLSANLIGSNQRTLKEGLTMGGKVLGEMLCANGCKIKTLKLAWNMIRFESGVELMQSLKQNHSLTYLDVSYNGLGDEGAQSFGDAIQVNTTLQSIMLSNNNISSGGCFCIIEGIKRCPNLVNVDLTNNPIGHRGGVSVMTAIIEIGDRVIIDIRGCSIARKEPNCWYDPENPTGEHTLELSKQYDRAVAIDLLKECAQSNGTYLVDDVRYTPDPKYDTRGAQNMQLTLRQGEDFAVHEAKRMPPQLIIDTYENECVKQQGDFLERLDESCEEVALDLACDKDHHTQFLEMVKTLKLEPDAFVSHFLTKNMTSSVLFRLGLGNYDWLSGQIFSIFDPLGLNCIEVNHLKEFFTALFPHYIDMWTEAVKSSYGDCYFEFEGKNYVPTNMGTLQLTVRRCKDKSANKTISTVQKILTLENINNILSSLKRTDNPYRMCEYALTNASLLFDEAWVMYKFMVNEVGEKNIVLSRLLPIMPNYFDARQLINKALGGDISGRVKLRQVMGPLYRLHTGNPTGFYTLHLSKAHDRSCMRQLFDFTRRGKLRRIKKMQLGDTSQYGNGNGFRNAVLDGAPLVVTEEWYTDMPDKGKLEFDFVHFVKSSNLEPMGDLRFKALLETVNLAPVVEEEEHGDHHFEQLSTTTSRVSFPLNSQMNEANVVCDFVQWCDDNKVNRSNIGFPNQLNPSNSRTDVVEDGLTSAKSRDRFKLNPVAPSVSSPVTTAHATTTSTNSPTPSAPATGRIGISRSYSNLSKVAAEVEVVENSKEIRAEKLLRAKRAKIWTVEYMVEAIGNGSISCAQLVSLFQEFISHEEALNIFNDILKKPFGTFQVELLISVFNQINDPANINSVLKLFSPFERAALIFRLGILNVWSSVYPDGYYKLDLSKKEEKLILRILITLSTAGSQDEFSELDYRADPLSKAMTAEDQEVAAKGMKLWRSERSFPEEGVVRFNFLSESSINNAKRQLPDSLHSEMLSFLYAPPLLLPSPGNHFSVKRGLEIPHSMKKSSILAANVGVKFNFDISSKKNQQEKEGEQDA